LIVRLSSAGTLGLRSATGSVQDLVHHLDVGVSDKRPAARRRLVEHRADGEDVRPMVGGFALDLFRSHVGDGAEDDPLASLIAHRQGAGMGVGGFLRRGQLGQPEIQHLGEAVRGHHDVFRLEVAVHDAGGMRFCQPLGCLRQIDQQRAQVRRSVVDLALERDPLDQLHRDVVDRICACG
jgi:hypothetical protein